MDETAFHGVQKRVDFLSRWALALFAVATLLISWLGARYEAGNFGILFGLGAACLALVAIIGGGLTVAAHLRIKRLEEHGDV